MKRLLFSLVFVLSFAFILSADTIVLSRENKDTGLVITQDNVFSRQAPGLILDCHVANMEAKDVATPKGMFTHIYIPGQFISHDVGAPQLPTINKIIEIPQGAELSVQVIASNETEYNLKDLGINYPLYPRQPSLPKDGSKSEFVYNPQAYQARGYLAKNVAAVEELGTLRSYRLALLTVFPVAYNPTESKIKVYNDIRIEVSLNGADYAKTLDIKTRNDSSAFNWVKDSILTSDSLKSLPVRSIERASNYLIVADRMFEDALKPFISWKETKGFAVTVSYTDVIGKTTDSIKTHIKEKMPDYVLFVGDKEQIPAFPGKASSAHITDLYYVTMDGDTDYHPDIVYGRFSAQTVEQLTPQITKTLTYEGDKENSEYLGRAVLTAGWDSSYAHDWGWPQIEYAKKYFFNTEKGYTDVNVKVTLTSGSGQEVKSIKDAINAGCSFVNYTAHGSQTSWADPSMSISDVKGYTNKDMYPIVVGNCCLTSSFQVSECFGEAWLRATHGAIGYIGGSNSTYWDEDLWWGNGHYSPIVKPYKPGEPPTMDQTTKGFYESLFNDGVSMSAAMQAGNVAVDASASSRKKYYWEVYHLFGDPALKFKFPKK